MSLTTAVEEVVRLSEQLQEVCAQRDRLLPLAKLGHWCLTTSREHFADIDGFELEDHAVKLGLLATVKVIESCGEECVCEVFPGMCYRETELAKLPEGASLG